MKLSSVINSVVAASSVAGVFYASMVFAANLSPVGLWQTIDDKTHKPGSVIQISKNGKGVYEGKVVKIYPTDGQKQTDSCKKCKGARKGKPILGLTLIRGMVKDGDKYKNGFVLDPRNGKDYKAQMRVSANGKELHLRGYIGLPIFGKTAVWRRLSQL